MPPSRPSISSKGRTGEVSDTTSLKKTAESKPSARPATARDHDDGPQIHYTVLLRLPFPREGFVDPPPVNWNASKEKTLWNKLSQLGKGDMEWDSLAAELDVSLQFLLQQAAWLYERQLSQVRAQMRKVGNPNISNVPSPVTGSETTSIIAGHAMRRGGSSGGGGAAAMTGGQAMRRTGSGAGGPRAPSSLSTRSKEGTTSIREDNTAAASKSSAPPMSRRSSAKANSPRPTYAIPRRLSSNIPIPVNPPKLQAVDSPIVAPVQDAASSPSSSSSSSSPAAVQKSHAFKRPVRFTPSRRTANDPYSLSNSGDADIDNNSDDEDSDAAFLPFSAPAEPAVNALEADFPDPSATIRDAPIHSTTGTAQRRPSETAKPFQQTDHSSVSSASSQSPAQTRSPHTQSRSRPTQSTQPVLSPQRMASIAARRQREGSEGTPASIGSSFSDLDDASVTQSALEEALASDMRRGAGSVASRVSGLGQALKSRYL